MAKLSWLILVVTAVCQHHHALGKDMLLMETKYGVKEPTVVNPRATTPDWGTFTQKLDHFNPFDERTWEMRYLNSSEFFQEGGPIFIYLGGEWTISASSIMTGQIFDMASDHNGYLFYTEHRFYGQSYPTEDYSTENLRYLTTDQALEDIANFIAYQKSLEEFQNSKVVVVGGSYSATLATWLRLKFPHLVDIAYSSSAPLRAVADFYEYLEVVNDAVNITDPECLSIIQEGIEQVENQLVTADGVTSILNNFSFCDNTTDITQEPERAYFFGTFTWSWSGIIQYARSGDIQAYCDIMHAQDGTSFDKLLAFIRAYVGSSCLGGYSDFIEAYNGSELTTGASRQWYYQTCTEYGFFQTTAGDRQPFGRTLLIDFYHQMCLDMYGVNLTTQVLDAGVDRINLLYGSIEPEVTKVVSVHGTIDPWHALGVLEDVNELSPTIVVTGASHCQDLSSANNETDSAEMYAAKIRVKEIIAGWLNEGTENDNSTTTTQSPGTTDSGSTTTEENAGISLHTNGVISTALLILCACIFK